MHLPVVNLAFMTCTYNKDAVLEDGRPEITSTEDLLGGSISGHMAATSAGVAVVQNPLSFLEGQATTEDRINAEAVQGIA